MSDFKVPQTWVNGNANGVIPSTDRGLAYGDGLFETCKLVSGQVPLWRWHKRRLLQDLKRLTIPLSSNSLERILEPALCQLREQEASGVLKIMVTRASLGRGYNPVGFAEPTVIVQFYEGLPSVRESYRVRLCSTRLSCNPATAGLKHLCRLENVLARSEWSDESIHEGLLFDTSERLIEAVSHNLFIVKDACLKTPDLSESGVCGVMREVLLDSLTQLSEIPSTVQALTLEQLLSADEVFLCNSVVGVVPVTELVSEQGIGLARWQAGELTAKIQQLAYSHTNTELAG